MDRIPDDVVTQFSATPLPAESLPDNWYMLQLDRIDVRDPGGTEIKATLWFTVIEGPYLGAKLPMYVGFTGSRAPAAAAALQTLSLDLEMVNELLDSKEYTAVPQVEGLLEHWGGDSGPERASLQRLRPLSSSSATNPEASK